MQVVTVRKARVRPLTQTVIAPTFGEPTTDVHRNIASIGNRLIEGWAALVKPLGGDTLHGALEARSVDRILAGLDWPAFVTAANGLADPLRHTLTSFARLEITPLERRRPVRKAAGTTFTVPTDKSQMKRLFTDIDSRAIDHAKVRSGHLIVSVQDDTRAAVREAVSRSLGGEMTVPQLARHLRAVVPLRPDQAATVERLRDAHLRNRAEAAARTGKPPAPDKWAAEAAVLVERASGKKIRARAALIARTEVVAASNQGRYLAWQATAASGLTATNSVKEWIAAAGACPECVALDGEQVPWDKPFSSGDDMPPDHPACRCSAVMLPPDAANDPQEPVYQGDSAPVPEPSPAVPEPPVPAAASKPAARAATRGVKPSAGPTRKPLDLADLPRLKETGGSLTAKNTNPNVLFGKEWKANCAQVVSATELRTRGYDVIARGVAGGVGGRSNARIARDWVTPAGKVREFTEVAVYSRGVGKAMQVATDEWPVGGRGFVSGPWESGGAHIFNVEKTATGLTYTDLQGPGRDADAYLDRLINGRVQILRVDDLVPSQNILMAVEDASGSLLRNASGSTLLRAGKLRAAKHLLEQAENRLVLNKADLVEFTAAAKASGTARAAAEVAAIKKDTARVTPLVSELRTAVALLS